MRSEIHAEALNDARILLVDDQPVITRIIEKYLRNEGYRNIVSVHQPERAATVYQEYQPDLVILDLSMPGRDGFQVIADIGAVEPDLSYLPILVASGMVNKEIRIMALKAGAKDFIHKPVDEEVITRVRNMLEVRLLYKRVRSENQRLEQAVSERTAELQAAQLDTVNRLAIAAEFRDDDTGAHISRIARYAVLLARAAGFIEEELEMLEHAAPMHDVGKIGIPDAILLKPGKLTPDEFEAMKAHTQIGARLLSNSSSQILQMAECIALSHHERWDGSGYPERRKAEDIPLVARIVAVADVFDALTSRRPYKEPWSDEKAVAEIQRSSGSHFDPAVVSYFERMLPEILAVRAELNPHSLTSTAVA